MMNTYVSDTDEQDDSVLFTEGPNGDNCSDDDVVYATDEPEVGAGSCTKVVVDVALGAIIESAMQQQMDVESSAVPEELADLGFSATTGVPQEWITLMEFLQTEGVLESDLQLLHQVEDVIAADAAACRSPSEGTPDPDSAPQAEPPAESSVKRKRKKNKGKKKQNNLNDEPTEPTPPVDGMTDLRAAHPNRGARKRQRDPSEAMGVDHNDEVDRPAEYGAKAKKKNRKRRKKQNKPDDNCAVSTSSTAGLRTSSTEIKGAPGSAHLTDGQRKRRQLRNKNSRAKVVRNALQFTISRSLSARFASAYILHHTLLDTSQLSHSKTGFKGKAASPGSNVPSLQDILDRGYQLIKWDATVTIIITDKDGRIIVVLGSQPKGGLPMDDVETALHEARKFIVRCKGSVRGPYFSERIGATYGNGDKEPHAFVLKPQRRKTALETLVKNHAIAQCAGHASALLAFYFPLKFDELRQLSNDLHAKHPALPLQPISNSIYPTMSFNLGPRVTTREHVDTMNYIGGMCTVTCGGDFDYTKGGHLYFTDLKIVVEFPPGGTILLPSSLLRHGNTSLQQGEKRFSCTQYCPGGLFRWRDQKYGTQTRWTKDEKAAYQAKGPARWNHILDTFSKAPELTAHHAKVYWS